MAGFSLGGDQRDYPAGFSHHSLFFSPARRTDATTRGLELWHQPLYPPSSGLLSFASPSPTGGGAGGVSCQDCGNQAKKDCAHQRCRTCCKSRGFACSTHVKSTWVPAAKRRERQQQQRLAASSEPSNSKRPRDMHRSTTTSSSLIVAPVPAAGSIEAAGTLGFPAEVRSPAVFRCMRVSPLDAEDEERAYQAAVSIAGHVFRGNLYDQGPDDGHNPRPQLSAPPAETPSATGELLEPATSPVFPTPISAFMAAGSQFFAHQPRPN